ncbi:HNH endonuclease, partial [Acidisoma sp. L85]|uniref:HNH endonuclease signature motif containing protein n=1 Tax=Acidisoma sp. L85 TaxID=1641850 RepID=UPI00131E2DF9
MARPPLVLSAHPSAWNADVGAGEWKAASASAACQFCGQPTGRWPEPFHLNDDHDDASPANLVTSCPLCHLPQHLNRPDIDDEAMLIWLPEMAQGALNVLARQIHLACAGEGLPPAYSDASRAAPAASAAYRAYRTLYDRGATAELRLGTLSPRQLGAALRDLAPSDYERRATLLGGVRLLPLGRLYRAGRDHYPTMLRDWAAPRS